MKRMYPKVVDLVYKYRTNNPSELARAMGIQVFYVDLKHEMNGVYVKIGEKQIVLIEKSLDFNHRQVVLAHELGHIFLKQHGKRFADLHLLSKEEKDFREYNANKFAFLLIAHTCLRNEPEMIDGIRHEKELTLEDTVRLLERFKACNCFFEY